VQLHPHRNSAVLSFADIVIDDEFVIKGLAIVKSQDGILHVNMPCKTIKDRDRLDIAHPITEDCRLYVQDMVLDAYDYFCGGPQPENLKVTWPSNSAS